MTRIALIALIVASALHLRLGLIGETTATVVVIAALGLLLLASDRASQRHVTRIEIARRWR
jgi:hypothetical protein